MDVLTEPAVTRGLRTSATAVRRWAMASLAVNIVIVVTGALVRLTGSGLGCPTWPRCSAVSYVTHPDMGIHGAIEFGNRMLTFVLVIVAVATWLVAMLYREDGRPRTDYLVLTTVLALGIPAQAVLGGITVLTHLNPFVVALHLLVSFALIAVSVALVRRTRGLSARPVPRAGVAVAVLAFLLMWVTVWLGTVLTGSGPHAGDQHAVRTGLDPGLVAHVHAIAVYATVAATVTAVLLLRNRAAVALLGLEVGQAVVGFLQYAHGLPVWLVTLHLLGAALAIALATNLVLSVRSPVRVRVDDHRQPVTTTGSRWPSGPDRPLPSEQPGVLDRAVPAAAARHPGRRPGHGQRSDHLEHR